MPKTKTSCSRIHNNYCTVTQWPTHNTVAHTQHSGPHTTQWPTHNTVVHTQHSGPHTTQWSTHNTVVHTQHSGPHTTQWPTHNTVAHTQHNTVHICLNIRSPQILVVYLVRRVAARLWFKGMGPGVTTSYQP